MTVPETPFRLLEQADEPALVALLERDPLYNIFALANLAAYGWQSPRVRYWAVERDGRLLAMLSQRGANCLFYDPDQRHAADAAALLDALGGVASLNGLWSHTAPVLEQMRRVRLSAHREQFCSMPLTTRMPEAAPYVRRAGMHDAKGLLKLYSEGEIQRDLLAIERSLRFDRVYVADVDGQIRSGLVVVGPTRHGALIVAVYTAWQARGCGYAAACTTAACRDLLAVERVPCLFWRNPLAGRIYGRVGFQSVCDWLLAQST